MSKKTFSPKNLVAVLVLAGLVTALLLVPAEDSRADDRDLLRFNTAKPYLFIIFDTSASMNLAPGNSPVPANGDDPASKLYSAKQVVYEVFQDVDDVHLGFASFNQNELRVQAKHWLYEAESSAPSSWPSIGYPAVGDLMVFGKHLDTATPGIAGSCGSPLALSDRETINRFAKLEPVDTNGNGNIDSSDVNLQTILFVRGGPGNRTYRLTVGRDPVDATGNPNDNLGRKSLKVRFKLEEMRTDCSGVQQTFPETNINFDLVREFLMVETAGATGGGGGNNAAEILDGFWTHSDALQSATCGNGHPFSGEGWEGNYDGTYTSNPGFAPPSPNNDPYTVCTDRNDPSTCKSLKRATQTSTFGRPLDRGDVLPLDWQTANKDDFLRRLSPSHGSGAPDFGVASYFNDLPDATGFLPLKNTNQKPMIGAGITPLGKSVVDFRCWYQGSGNKCKDSAYPNGGWEDIGQSNDSEWGCRRPYLIVISDGDDTCAGENPCADTASLNSKSSVRTWVVAYGNNCASAGNPLKCMAQNGKGELVCPSSPQNLKDELQRILGEIREEARAFASAAVPSVQTNVEDKVFLTNFTPLNGKSIWDGHLHSFLKPLPLDTAGRPDESSPLHQWDAGEVLLTQAPDATEVAAGTLKLGTGSNERRVFYSRLFDTDGDISTSGTWARNRRLFSPTQDATDPDIRYDFWKALQIPFNLDDPIGTPAVDQTAQNRANQVVRNMLVIKEHTLDKVDPVTGNPTTEDIEYVLGDIFHSDPLVVGSPSNVKFFALNLEDDGTRCEDGNPSYRCFFRKHQFRRKLILVGANDGMVHGFEAGLPTKTGTGPSLEVTFDNGTGKEVFAYMPRLVMPKVRQLAEGTNHQFTVDGTIKVADVFVDPVQEPAASTFPEPNDREWRTVAIGGLREGGVGYYALDLTQPDVLDGDFVPQPINGDVPSCLGTPLAVDGSVNVSDCGPIPYASMLWEFDDSVLDTTISPPTYVRLDEDANTHPDLAATWSIPNIGRIRICEGSSCDPAAATNDIVFKHVAIFGGGFDPTSKSTPQAPNSGDWLYIVDIETGQTLYKRRLRHPSDPTKSAGPAASEPAAVDTDQDGTLDRIYIGTLGGFLFRVDLGLTSDGRVPRLVDLPVRDVNNVIHMRPRIQLLDGNANPVWQPRVIFDANFDGTTPTAQPRQIFHRPSVIFVAKLGLYALAFGTGDREDLWTNAQQNGRFYLFVDDTEFLSSASLPLTEAALAQVNVTDAATNTDLLLARSSGQRGWYMVLDPEERVITNAFAISGITFFSTFKPLVQVTGNKDPLCSKEGDSRVFVVGTTNGNGFLSDPDTGDVVRQATQDHFVTNPFSELGQGRNPSPGPDPCQTPELQQVMESLKSLFPQNCKFANYRIDIKTITADTGVVCIAPVPVCIVEKNWKEHN